MSSQAPVTSTAKTDVINKTQGPSPQAAPYFPPLYATGANALAQNQATPIPSRFVAGATPAQESGAQQMIDVAPTTGTMAPGIENVANQISSGYFLNPQNDPTFAGAVNAALTPSENMLMGTTLPNIVGGAIRNSGMGGGPTAYGGASLGMPEESAIRDWDIAAQNTGAAMANASRNAGMNLFQQLPALQTAAISGTLAPAAATEAGGALQQGFAQNDINNAIAQYQAMMNAPWAGVGNMTNLLTAGGYGTTTGTDQSQGTTTGPAPNVATQWLQGLTGGASGLASLFAPKTGAFPNAVSGGTNWLSNLFNPQPAAVPTS